MMTSFARVYKGFLSVLSQLPLKQLKVLSAHFTRGQLSAIREVLTNILAGNVELTPEQRQQLKPYKTFIRRFAKSSLKRCHLKRNCRAILIALKAAKNTIDQL